MKLTYAALKLERPVTESGTQEKDYLVVTDKGQMFHADTTVLDSGVTVGSVVNEDISRADLTVLLQEVSDRFTSKPGKLIAHLGTIEDLEFTGLRGFRSSSSHRVSITAYKLHWMFHELGRSSMENLKAYSDEAGLAGFKNAVADMAEAGFSGDRSEFFGSNAVIVRG